MRVLSSVENHQDEGLLALRFADSTVARLPHALLRAACLCAECRALRRAGLTIDADPQVRLALLEPVGLYALNLGFTDGHRRGIYPFEMLTELACASHLNCWETLV